MNSVSISGVPVWLCYSRCSRSDWWTGRRTPYVAAHCNRRLCTFTNGGALAILPAYRFLAKRDDLQLILFSALLLLIIVCGTLWIMVSLARRMGVSPVS